MTEPCTQAVAIGQMQSTINNLVAWQRTQNGHLKEMNQRLWAVLITMMGVLIFLAGNAIMLYLKLRLGAG
jgi:hypothetical protein